MSDAVRPVAFYFGGVRIEELSPEKRAEARAYALRAARSLTDRRESARAALGELDAQVARHEEFVAALDALEARARASGRGPRRSLRRPGRRSRPPSRPIPRTRASSSSRGRRRRTS